MRTRDATRGNGSAAVAAFLVFAAIVVGSVVYVNLDEKKEPAGYRLTGAALERNQACVGGMVVWRYVNRVGYKITYYMVTENDRPVPCVLKKPPSK